jgi:hypothetical protein
MARAWQRWHQLGGRVRPALGDACLVGKGHRPAAAVAWDSKPLPSCSSGRGPDTFRASRSVCDRRSVTAAVGSIVVSLAARFVVMIAGWALRRWFRFGDAFWAEVERLAYWVLLPALLMIGLARSDFGAVPAVSMIVVLACSCAAAGLLALAVRRLVAGDNGPAFTSVVQGTVRFNNYIGLTLATGLYGALACLWPHWPLRSWCRSEM